MARVCWLLAAWCVLAVSAQAQDRWLGQYVFWKDGAQAKVGERRVNIELILFPARVGKVNGEWLWLGRAWVRTSDVHTRDQALAYYNGQVRRNPRDARALRARGSVWSHLGKVDEVLADYTESLCLDPSSAVTYNNRGVAWSDKGEPENAIKDCTEAIRLDPTYAYAYNGIAWLRATYPLDRYRDGAEAVKVATKACELTNFKDANHLDTLAAAHAEAGQFDQAVEWQQKALDLACEAEKASFAPGWRSTKGASPIARKSSESSSRGIHKPLGENESRAVAVRGERAYVRHSYRSS